jgi:alpha-glucosidase
MLNISLGMDPFPDYCNTIYNGRILSMEEFIWWRDGVIYQVYPRSFSDTNGDGIGDLQGITSHLDYLAHLGIDAIWLSPFYPTPDADFGYDISDHTQVDARFGSLQDFDDLLNKAHALGIRIILDLVLNHTSHLHPWFLESKSSPTNPKREWYLWRERKNNWQAVTGGSGWTFDPITGQYYFHMFLPEQPDLNWNNPEVRQAQMDVVRFWLDRGVDGFRLDVFNAYLKDARFLNNPPKLGVRGFDRQKHLYDNSQPGMYSLLKEFRSLLEKYPGSYSVGETFLSTTEKAARYVGNDLLHAAFSFDFTSDRIFFPWNPAWLLERIKERERIFQGTRWPVTVMSNHDLPRAASRYSHSEDDAQVRIVMTLLLTLRGTPFIYYGEEIGARDITLERNQILDPPGKHFWPLYKGRDGCRAPMQWDDSPQAGFSTNQPWLPIHPDFKKRNVANQEMDPDSMLNFTRKLISFRKQYPALRTGNFTELACNSRHVLAYLRQVPGQTILVMMNFSRRKANVTFKPAIPSYIWRFLHPGANGILPKDDPFELGGHKVAILIADD